MKRWDVGTWWVNGQDWRLWHGNHEWYVVQERPRGRVALKKNETTLIVSHIWRITGIYFMSMHFTVAFGLTHYKHRSVEWEKAHRCGLIICLNHARDHLPIVCDMVNSLWLWFGLFTDCRVQYTILFIIFSFAPCIQTYFIWPSWCLFNMESDMVEWGRRRWHYREDIQDTGDKNIIQINRRSCYCFLLLFSLSRRSTRVDSFVGSYASKPKASGTGKWQCCRSSEDNEAGYKRFGKPASVTIDYG